MFSCSLVRMTFDRFCLSGLLFLTFPFVVSCLGTDLRGGILRYESGVAYSGVTQFTAGKLPPTWQGPELQLKQLVFKNDALGATIVADALCGPKYNDAPLPRLAQDLFFGMTDKKIEKEKIFTLSGREALSLQGVGKVDGVPIKMNVVVLKRNFCEYDFVYLAPPHLFYQGIKDFEGYLHGIKIR